MQRQDRAANFLQKVRICIKRQGAYLSHQNYWNKESSQAFWHRGNEDKWTTTWSSWKAFFKNWFSLPCTIKLSDPVGPNCAAFAVWCIWKKIQKWPVISLFFFSVEKQSETAGHQVIVSIQSVHKAMLNISFSSISIKFNKIAIVHK